MTEDVFNFDLERMKKAVNSPSVRVPGYALESVESFDAWLNDITTVKDASFDLKTTKVGEDVCETLIKDNSDTLKRN